MQASQAPQEQEVVVVATAASLLVLDSSAAAILSMMTCRRATALAIRESIEFEVELLSAITVPDESAGPCNRETLGDEITCKGDKEEM